MYGNWIKNAENHSSKEESTKSKLRNSQEKIKSEYNEN